MNICLTFDTNKIESSTYGNTAWFTFWSVIREKDLGVGARLFCGDLLTANPSYYGILVEADNSKVVAEIKRRFSSNDAFKQICGSSPFIEGTSGAAAHLINAGTIDSRCVLVGGRSDWARVALATVKLPELEKIYSKDTAASPPQRTRPASARTSGLQEVTGMAALKQLLKSTFPSERDFVSLLPEEVCDLADSCSEHFYVAWELSAGYYTESSVEIHFMEKAGEQQAIYLRGFFNFPSASDIDRPIREAIGYNRTFLNVTGITALNLIGPKDSRNDTRFNEQSKAWMAKENLTGDLLWKYVHLRKIQLGLIPEQTAKSASPVEQSQPRPFTAPAHMAPVPSSTSRATSAVSSTARKPAEQKKWWQFWK